VHKPGAFENAAGFFLVRPHEGEPSASAGLSRTWRDRDVERALLAGRAGARPEQQDAQISCGFRFPAIRRLPAPPNRTRFAWQKSPARS